MRHAISVAKLKLTNDVRQAVKEFQRFSVQPCDFFPILTIFGSRSSQHER